MSRLWRPPSITTNRLAALAARAPGLTTDLYARVMAAISACPRDALEPGRDGGPGPIRGAHVGRLRREFGAVPKQKLVAGVQEAAAVLHGLAERARHHDWGQVPAGRQPQARLSFVLGNRKEALPSQPPTDGAAEPRSTRIRQMSVASPREKAETRSAKSTGSPAITGFLDHTEPPA